MAEYIFEISDVLYDEETGEAVMKPDYKGELIRCKDCKHYVLYELFGRSQGWCERLCDKFDKSLARGTEDDDFCSRGERRENDGSD